jgi:hypothetical protein
VTAIVILSIIGLIAFIILVAGIIAIRSAKVQPLMDIVKTQRDLILKIEELADVERELSNPLAWQILKEIRDARKKENSK